MFEMAISAAGIVFDPSRLMFVALGVVIGLSLGVIPGLSGIVGLSLLLPFTFDMDPYTALAFLVGLQAVVATSDTIPAVLFGVPGTVGSAATILDGHPMAKQGLAARAFGAAFSASVLGGLLGAVFLAFSIPLLRPFILSFGSPELLAFCIFGLSLIGVLSGGNPLKGLAAAGIGLVIATTGEEPNTAVERWTFGSLYLLDGIPIVPLALGLFALPELADMAIARRNLPDEGPAAAGHGQLAGIRDTLSNLPLVLRGSAIGSVLGAVPGIGAPVIPWIAYGHALRSEKGAAETFGKGDVRGVIAAESSNNAKEGGALVSTIAFGVPATAAMALLLGAFLIHGLSPGPDMLTTRLDVSYTLVWTVAIANVLGCAICFAFARQLAGIARIRIGILAPVVLSIVFIGAFQATRQWGDIIALLGFGLLGWAMKRVDWPRPPLLLGLVLGGFAGTLHVHFLPALRHRLAVAPDRHWRLCGHPLQFAETRHHQSHSAASQNHGLRPLRLQARRHRTGNLVQRCGSRAVRRLYWRFMAVGHGCEACSAGGRLDRPCAKRLATHLVAVRHRGQANRGIARSSVGGNAILRYGLRFRRFADG